MSATGRRGGRQARIDARSRQVAEVGTGDLLRKVRPYELMDDEALATIETKADEILRDIGVEFRDDPKAIDAFRAWGADVEGDRVRFAPGSCRELIGKHAPESFVQHARNPERSVTFGGDSVVWVVLEGRGRLDYPGSDEPLAFAAGDTILLPAELKRTAKKARPKKI